MLAATTIAVLVTLALPPSRFAQASPLGAEFVVNSYSTGDQFRPDVATQSSGGFVVTWQSNPQPAVAAADIVARRFDSLGEPVGIDFQVSSHTSGGAEYPRVAVLSDDGFVVVWRLVAGTEDGIYGQRFDSTGAALGTEFQVNTYTSGDQDPPAVAAGPGGTFTVVWHGPETFMRRYDGAGSPLGPPVQVNTAAVGDCQVQSTIRCWSDVATNAAGASLVVWPSSAPGGAAPGLGAQLFDAGGSPVGGEFAVNTYTTGLQAYPSVAAAADGGFLVAWSSEGPTFFTVGVVARRFDSLASPVGGEVVVSPGTGAASKPRVASATNTDFLVAWAGSSTTGSRARRLDSTGTPLAPDFRLRTTDEPTGIAPAPPIACGPADELVAVWHSAVTSEGFDGSNGAIVGRFACAGGPGDADGDGTSDLCDVCTNTGAQGMSDKTRIKMQRINTDPVVGNDRISFSGEFTLPAGSDFSTIDPITTRVRVHVAAADGTGRVDVKLPTAAFGGVGTAGWKQSGSGRKWTYTDKRPHRSNGIKKAAIVDKSSKSPGVVKVKARGLDGIYAIVPTDLPLTATFVVGDPISEMCGEIVFAAGECSLPGSRLSCRR